MWTAWCKPYGICSSPHVSADTLQNLALFLPALFLSLSVHEFAHAWAATRLGDPTPAEQGRLTLSPMAHLDPIGSLAFPILLQVTSGGFFGWAKPVQFRPHRFNRDVSIRTGTALTAAAGPASNLVLALLFAVVTRILVQTGVGHTGNAALAMISEFCSVMVGLNILLAVFNLFPLPPLDGSHLLPASMDSAKAWMERYSMILFMVLFFVPLPGLGGSLGFLVIGPVEALLSHGIWAMAFAGLR